MSLREHDVAVFDTHHGWVATVAVYDRDLPRGAVVVSPGPFLTYTPDGYRYALAQGHRIDFRFQVVTKAIGEYDPAVCTVESARDWMFVRDIDVSHEWVDDGDPHWADEGFYAFTYPTLFHRVVETDNPDLAALVVAEEGGHISDALVPRPAAT